MFCQTLFSGFYTLCGYHWARPSTMASYRSFCNRPTECGAEADAPKRRISETALRCRFAQDAQRPGLRLPQSSKGAPYSPAPAIT